MKYLNYNEKLERCYSAVIMDVMDRMNFRVQCMEPAVRPLVPTMRTWGEAVTMYFEAVVEVPEHPFQLEMEVLDGIRKAAGVITDGGARDYKEIVDLNFPTFCKGLTPYDSLGRMDGKGRDIPIVCGGIRVNPGDLVFGDIDGVVVVPREIVKEVIERAWEKVQGENTVREELRAGASLVKTFEKYGIL